MNSKMIAMTMTMFVASISVPAVADSGHHPDQVAADSSTQLVADSGQATAPGSPAGSMPMMQGQGNMPMMQGQGNMPMMGGNMDNMPMMQMMQQRHTMMQEHMSRMETHMMSIESLLKQLVELQKG